MLNNMGTQTIETERLILRQFTLDDAQAMFDNWATDDQITKYMQWLPHKDIEETKQLIAAWIEEYSYKTFYQWAITLKETGMPIGAFALIIVDENNETGDVGYCIGQEFWGNGYVTEALKAVLGFAFKTVQFNRIETFYAVNNPASGRVMEKAGLTFEGMARQKYKGNFGFEDSNLYAILKEDFK